MTLIPYHYSHMFWKSKLVYITPSGDLGLSFRVSYDVDIWWFYKTEGRIWVGTYCIKGSCSRPRSHLCCFTRHKATKLFVKGSLDPQNVYAHIQWEAISCLSRKEHCIEVGSVTGRPLEYCMPSTFWVVPLKLVVRSRLDFCSRLSLKSKI